MTKPQSQLLTPASVAVAGALGVAGLAVLDPAFLGWIEDDGAGSYSLTGYYLLLHALVLAAAALWASSREDAPTAILVARMVVKMVTIGFGALDFILALTSTFGGTFSAIAFVLVVPGALSVAAALVGSEGRENEDAASDGDAEDVGHISVGSTEGKPSPFGAIQRTVFEGLASAALLAVMMAFLVPGVLLYETLKTELINGQLSGLAGFVGLFEAMASEIGPFLIVGAVLLPAIFVLVGLVTALSHRVLQWRFEKAARDLTPAETTFIEQAYAKVHDHAAQHDYERLGNLAFFVWFPLFILVTLAPLVWIAWFRRNIAQAYAPPPVDDGQWHFVLYDSSFATVPGLLLWGAAAWALYHLACRLFERFGAFAAWWSRQPPTDSFTLRQTLVRMVRVGRLRPGGTFDPRAFLLNLNARRAPYAFASAGVLALATVVLLDRDLRDYTLFTDDYIETVDYWSGAKSRITYADIRYVELACSEGRNSSLDTDYRVHHGDDASLALIQQLDLVDQLADLERIDRLLVSAGVRFHFAVRHPAYATSYLAFDDACLARLTAQHDPHTAQRIKTLFHLEDWLAMTSR